jgi:hypothetical protein
VGIKMNLNEYLLEEEKRFILWALKSTNGHRGKAAALLEVPRTTMLMRMKKFGLFKEWPTPDRYNPRPKKRKKALTPEHVEYDSG